MSGPTDCAAVRAALVAGEPIDTRHVAQCPACSALLDGELAGSIAEPPPPEEDPIVQAVLAKVRADRAPVVRLPTPARAGALAAGVAAICALAWAFGAGPRSAVDPLGASAALALAAAVALRPVHREPVAHPTLWIGGALAIPVLLGLLPPWAWAAPMSAWGCLWRGLVVVGLVAVALARTDRRTEIAPATWFAATAAGGGAATLALAVWCPFEGSWHRVVAHGGPGLAGAAAVAAVSWARGRT